MRGLLSLTLMMLLLSVILGFYHWLEFQSEVSADEDQAIQLNIDLNYQADVVNADVHFSVTKKREVDINIPEQAELLDCQLNGEECLVEDISGLDETDNLLIRYQIPFNVKDQVLTHWIPDISSNQASPRYELIVTSNLDSEYEWYTFSKPVHEEAMEHINYKKYHITNTNNIPLIVLKGNYEEMYLPNQIGVLASVPFKLESLKELIQDFSNIENQLFIINPNFDQLHSEHISFLEHGEKSQVASALLSNQIMEQIKVLQEEDYVLLNAINHYFYSSGAKSEHGQAIVKELQQHLTDSDRKAWLEILKNTNQTHETLGGLLDESLNELNLNTNFFKENSNDELHSFTLIDQREVFYQNEKVSLTNPLLNLDGRSYLALDDFNDVTQFRIINTSPEDILIQKESDQIRLFPERDLVIINEMSYRTEPNFIKKVNGKLYLRMDGLDDVLPISVRMSNDQIHIRE
ncbi:hypothetical protein [Aquisalibacillus elongatus]|uniref:Copper amine oxidase-like protein n=1 Tax=Aquisalibacillus elongatus TaxID=485577 RepID=A0A3N5BF39_9BACI|nr:hypothetical protein [Aquisalibacillus elongatus]RPF56103.1 hypothetical protein EDC24_0991 [Aquisalibacillus elongatus]